MVQCALMVRLEAKPGKEQEVDALLRSARAMVQEEFQTSAWFALRIGPREFAIFDVFPDESGRRAHLTGKLTETLFAHDLDLLAREPEIIKMDVLADKMPGVQPEAEMSEEAFMP